ncbi:hypothetical protein KQI52_07275 [bacterium]|nr:hypothetical protein [bacterium]
MTSDRLRNTLSALLNRRESGSRPKRLAIAATLDTPVGELKSLVDLLRETERYELHIVGPDETINALDQHATLHPAYLPDEIDRALGNLLTSGGVDLGLLLADPRRPEPSAVARMTPAFGNRTLTGISLLHTEKLDRITLLADTLVADRPDEDGLTAVTEQAIKTARKLGIETPRVALLAAVEVANPGLPATMLEQAVAQRFAERDDCHVHGPLSMDLAVSKSAVEKKKATGEVPGKADVLVGPTLTVSRGVLHAFQHGCGESAVTVLTGGQLPVAVAQRGLPIATQLLAVQFAELLV